MSGWKKAKLGDCCVENGIQTGPFGSQLHQSDYSEAGTPVIMPKDIRDGRVVEDGIARVGEVHVKRLSRHRVAKNNIVYPRRGDVGKAAFITGKEVGWLCGTGCLKVDLNEDVVDPVFIRYFLALNDSVSWLEKHAVGSTMLNINAGILAELPIALPPLPTQRRIAAMLSDYDSAIDNARRQIALLEEAAMRLYREWFVVNADPKWGKVMLDSVINFQEGPGIRNWQYVKGEGTRFINIRCINDGDLILSGANKISNAEATGKYSHFMLRPYDIVLSCSGTLGRSAIVREEHLPLCLNTSVIRFSPKISRFDYAFVWAYLRSDAFLNAQRAMANGSAQVNFGPTHLKRMTLVWPSESRRVDFNVKCFPMIESMVKLRASISRLTEARDRLLPKLMSGEIEV